MPLSPLVALVVAESTAVAAPAEATVLVCAPGACAQDAALVRQLGVAGAMVDVELLLALDAVGAAPELPEARLTRRLSEALDAASAGQWRAVREATEGALQALDDHPGTVDPQTLFTVGALHALALQATGAADWRAPLRQATAWLDDGRPDPMPPGPGLREAWLDTRRELEATGRGVLVLPELAEGSRWWIDGRRVGPGEHRLLAGEHRVTAAPPGASQTFKVTAAVLPERTTTLPADLDDRLLTHFSGAWMLQRLERAFSTLRAPPPVMDRLADWCAQQGLDRLRLLRVVEGVPQDPTVVRVGPPALSRPAAAEGPARDYGEGVETTWEAHLADQHAGRGQDRVWREPQVQVLVFDARTRTLAVEVRSVEEPVEEPVLHLGLHAGWAALLDQPHAAAELSVGVGRAAWRGELRVGAVRAPSAYRLTPRWEDRQLYRVLAGARFTPWREAPWGPYAVAGPALLVPVSVGVRGILGLEFRPLDRWRLAVEATGGAGGHGLDAGLGGVLGGAW